MSQATTTTDHDEIRRWAEERGGRPSVVRTGRGKGGILRFDFGEDDEKLEETSWEEFFQIFDENGLVFLHQDSVGSGEISRFFKFVARTTASRARKPSAAKRSTARRPSSGAKRSAARGGAATPRKTAGAAKRSASAAKSSAKGSSK